MYWIYSLFSVFFAVLLYGLWIRFLVKYFQVRPANAICKGIMTYTDWLVMPFDKILSGIKSGRIEWSCLMVLAVIEILQGYILVAIHYHAFFPVWKLVFLLIGDPLVCLFNIFAFSMLLRLLLEWSRNSTFDSLREIVNTFTLPFIRYSRDLIPFMGGFDVAPLCWMVLFKVLAFVIHASIVVYLL